MIEADIKAIIDEYAPILCLHKDEQFRPISVEPFLKNSTLLVHPESQLNDCNPNILKNSIKKSNRNSILTLCSPNKRKINFTRDLRFHKKTVLKYQKEYLNGLNKDQSQYTVYAHYNEYKNRMAISYYFFYLGNTIHLGTKRFNFEFKYSHDCDWELIRIFFKKKKNKWVPNYIYFAQHDYNPKDQMMLSWESLKEYRVDNRVFILVSKGGHASYPATFENRSIIKHKHEKLKSRTGRLEFKNELKKLRLDKRILSWFGRRTVTNIVGSLHNRLIYPEFGNEFNLNGFFYQKQKNIKIFGKYKIVYFNKTKDSEPPYWLDYRGAWGNGLASTNQHGANRGPSGPKEFKGALRSWNFVNHKDYREGNLDLWTNQIWDHYENLELVVGLNSSNLALQKIKDELNSKNSKYEKTKLLEFKADITHFIGLFHEDLGNINEGIIHFQRASELYDELEEHDSVNFSKIMKYASFIEIIYNLDGQDAREILKDISSIIEDFTKSRREYGEAYGREIRGMMYLKLGKVQNAGEDFKRAMQIYSKSGYLVGRGHLYQLLVFWYFSQKSFDQITEIFSKNARLIKKSKDKRLKFSFFRTKGKYHIETMDFKSGLSSLNISKLTIENEEYYDKISLDAEILILNAKTGNFRNFEKYIDQSCIKIQKRGDVRHALELDIYKLFVDLNKYEFKHQMEYLRDEIIRIQKQIDYYPDFNNQILLNLVSSIEFYYSKDYDAAIKLLSESYSKIKQGNVFINNFIVFIYLTYFSTLRNIDISEILRTDLQNLSRRIPSLLPYEHFIEGIHYFNSGYIEEAKNRLENALNLLKSNRDLIFQLKTLNILLDIYSNHLINKRKIERIMKEINRVKLQSGITFFKNFSEFSNKLSKVLTKLN